MTVTTAVPVGLSVRVTPAATKAFAPDSVKIRMKPTVVMACVPICRTMMLTVALVVMNAPKAPVASKEAANRFALKQKLTVKVSAPIYKTTIQTVVLAEQPVLEIPVASVVFVPASVIQVKNIVPMEIAQTYLTIVKTAVPAAIPVPKAPVVKAEFVPLNAAQIAPIAQTDFATT